MVLIANTLLNILFSGTLQQILSVLKQLQIMVHMMLVRVKSPGNVNLFFGFLLVVVAMDPLDMDDVYDEYLSLDETNPIAPNFSYLGYQSLYSMKNFGSLILTLIGVPLLSWLAAGLLLFK